MRLVYGQDAAVAAWVAARIGHMGGQGFGPCSAIGVVDAAGRPAGGVVFHDWRPQYGGVEMSGAAARPDWLTRPLIARLLSYPFAELGCRRVTCLTPKRARGVRRFLERLGFRREGLIRQGFGEAGDMVVYGLLRREWDAGRWGK